MINFIGTYDCKADAKGRVMIPVALKNQMSPILNQSFVIKRSVFQPCLELYPMEEWNLLMEKMNKKNRFKKKNNDFIRRFSAGVKVIEIDATGRMLIPKNLVEIANISKEVVLSSAINIIEIWDKDSYEKVLEETAEDFAELAEEVMGDDGDDESYVS
ncbi:MULTISPECIES: division/cell wall cluster transcriptional repressor MraZ [Zobellia]|uniref:division/cell wall cluster transcriptional repressor MraZ n=1 Tax=Zobellia TaxID=112040 RepID=UPI001BFF1919|nr:MULTISPECIES: division/cell wall cluster transcriptional repressor MraZ [Zobellia]MBT9189858.1 division/cell wall cluster transcriptional repressor MraZ [Zobellia russellii]MBU2972810.1 division/cell wall cluster transcriptional repressor MraZ [Zobellia sp. B3R18]MDO6819961.1 division/cell wall cluster transcriptional repressor MraZ [Zobellia sp. 1_MG-2023]